VVAPLVRFPEAATRGSTPPELPSDVKLCGMRSLNGKVRVMFALTPPGEDTEFLSVPEGDRSGPGGIEVLEGGVDIDKGTVRVKVKGVEKTLSIEDDGYQGGGAKAKGGRTARPLPGGRNPRINPAPSTARPTGSRIPGPPGTRSTPSNSSTTRGFPRPIRTSSSRSQPVRTTGTTAIPAPTANRTVRLNTSGQMTSVNPPKPIQTMNAIDQEIVMRATHLNEQQNPKAIEVNGKLINLTPPPLPPMRQ
ncbi:MAG: hypothetical protein ACPGVU_15580, partial [Limisphaerales bacterium]